MKRGIFASVLALGMLSCSLAEIGRIDKDHENGVWVAPSVEHQTPQMTEVLYVTGFDYPADYDWRSDSGQGSVRCSLVVFADGSPVLKVPVGNEYKVSSDPDRHRVVDGHLYTFFQSDSRIHVKRDGKPCMDYPGNESMAAISVMNDSIYTLGQDRAGQGFSYRVNGRTVLSRDGGYVFEHLAAHDGNVEFAYCEQIRMESGHVERFYHVRNGVVSQIPMREDVKKVWDICCSADGVRILVSLTGAASPVVMADGDVSALSLPAGASLISCRFVPAENAVWVEGVISASGSLRSVLWKDGDRKRVFDAGMTIAAICVPDGGDAHCVLNPTSSSDGFIYKGGDKVAMPRGYACMGTGAADYVNGFLHVGLSSTTGARPLLWVDGQTHEYDLHGYICTVSSLLVRTENDY